MDGKVGALVRNSGSLAAFWFDGQVRMRPDFDVSNAPDDLVRFTLERQRNILNGEAKARFLASALGYGVCAIYLPIGLIVLLAILNLGAEILSDTLLRNPGAVIASPRRHAIVLASTFTLEVCFVLPPALMWHLDDPFVKALAVGMAAGTMMHIATVRAIHLPMGLSGAAAIWSIVLTTNALYWVPAGDWTALAVSTVCALAGLGYFLSAMLSNHSLHRETATSWAEAMAANSAKSRFLAQMSHELRTPLNAILGMGHAELARHTDPVSRSHLGLLVESAAGLGVLLDDILDMAAVQEGRLPIRVEQINPRTILSGTVALFRPQAEAGGLRLDLVLDPDLPGAARTDGRRLRQCVSNILSNALKYTDRGSVRLTARMMGDGLLCVDVEDSGRGVPEDQREAIFEPFHRLAGPQTGTGLGLTISRTLARRMGGDLVLLPSPRGARFRLTLPLAAADLPTAIDTSRPLSLRGHVILVVDDIASNRLVAATYLRQFGAEVIEADSGASALCRVAANRPSAVLLDMNMPGMGGIVTLGRLRDMPGAHLPVIAMTADATEDHRLGYLAAGLDGYVSKPLSPDRLAEALRPHLPPRAPAAAAPDYNSRAVG